jgi:uncharacterized membrane protein
MIKDTCLYWDKCLFCLGRISVVNPINEPTSDDKLWSGLSYAGLACCMVPTLVIFFLKKGESDYIKFNALQAIGTWLVVLVIGIILTVLSHIPVIGMLVGLVHLLVSLVLIAGWIYLMIQAFGGKEVRIPVLGDFIEQNLMG